jgi:hypothetical protein
MKEGQRLHPDHFMLRPVPYPEDEALKNYFRCRCRNRTRIRLGF